MRRSLAVHRPRCFRNTPVAALLSSLTSVALTCFGFILHLESALELEARVTDAHKARHLAHLPSSIPAAINQHSTQVAFVEDLIEDDIPSHPNKESIAQLIVAESRKADIDPLLVTAVVRTESMFRHKAVSHRGAKGLMQLMPSTGHYVSKLSKIELRNSEHLHDPETNIKLGIWYLKYLNEKFKGNQERVLVAYNWGPSNVKKALARGSAVPQQARDYAHKVLSRHSAWSTRLRQFASVRAATSVG